MSRPSHVQGRRPAEEIPTRARSANSPCQPEDRRSSWRIRFPSLLIPREPTGTRVVIPTMSDAAPNMNNQKDGQERDGGPVRIPIAAQVRPAIRLAAGPIANIRSVRPRRWEASVGALTEAPRQRDRWGLNRRAHLSRRRSAIMGPATKRNARKLARRPPRRWPISWRATASRSTSVTPTMSKTEFTPNRLRPRRSGGPMRT